MKRTLFLLACTLSTLIINAQKFQLGIKGGVNFASPKYTATGVSNVSGKAGANVGAFATIGALGINVQPEIAFSQMNFEYTEAGTVRKFKQNYMSIPVLLKFSIPLTGLGLYAGPQYSNLLSAKRNGVDYKSSMENAEWAGVFGADFKIPVIKLIVAARYQFGITDMITTGDKLKNNAATVSLGLKF